MMMNSGVLDSAMAGRIDAAVRRTEGVSSFVSSS